MNKCVFVPYCTSVAMLFGLRVRRNKSVRPVDLVWVVGALVVQTSTSFSTSSIKSRCLDVDTPFMSWTLGQFFVSGSNSPIGEPLQMWCRLKGRWGVWVEKKLWLMNVAFLGKLVRETQIYLLPPSPFFCRSTFWCFACIGQELSCSWAYFLCICGCDWQEL